MRLAGLNNEDDITKHSENYSDIHTHSFQRDPVVSGYFGQQLLKQAAHPRIWVPLQGQIVRKTRRQPTSQHPTNRPPCYFVKNISGEKQLDFAYHIHSRVPHLYYTYIREHIYIYIYICIDGIQLTNVENA